MKNCSESAIIESLKKTFFSLRTSVWSKNKGGGAAPPLDSYRPYRLTRNSLHVRQPKAVPILGFQIPRNGIRILFQWNWISVVRGIPDSLSCTFSRFQSPGFRIPQAKITQIPDSMNKIFRIPLHGAQKVLSQEPKCNCNYPVVPVSLGFRFSPVFHAVNRYHLYLH